MLVVKGEECLGCLCFFGGHYSEEHWNTQSAVPQLHRKDPYGLRGSRICFFRLGELEYFFETVGVNLAFQKQTLLCSAFDFLLITYLIVPMS